MCYVKTGRIQESYTDGLNITVKSASEAAGQLLAPTWELVMGYKHGELSEAQYTERYLQLLRTRYAKNKTAFIQLLKRESITLQCYCRTGQFCHRHIVVDVLEKIARHEKLAFKRGGER